MRHLIFLFSIILVVVSGCSKKTQVSALPPLDTSNQETNHDGEPDKADAAVDVFIHNSTSNEYVVQLEKAFAAEALKPGETGVVPVRWRYWADLDVSLAEVEPGHDTRSVVVPLAEVNQKIPHGGYSQVRFDVLDAYNVDVFCDKIGTVNSQEQALIPIPPDTDTSSQAADQKSSQDPKQAHVHIIVHHDSTNSYWVQFDKTGPDMPPVPVWPGQTGISSLVPWNYLPGAKVVLTDEHTGQKYFVDVSFATANEKLSSGKCHKVGLWVDSPDQIRVDGE